ncbi:MAG: hypothetical protein R2836_05425 [Chitinophagales bacterium]
MNRLLGLTEILTPFNTATHTLAGQGGACDTLVTLDLTINNQLMELTCKLLRFINMDRRYTYTSNNSTATHTITGGAANVLYLVVTLNLTASYTVNSIDVQTACNSFIWIDGNTYNSSNNTATHTITGEQLMVVILW